MSQLRQRGDLSGESECLNGLGYVADTDGVYADALAYYWQSLGILRSIHDDNNAIVATNNIGLVYQHLGEEHKALVYFLRALALWHKSGDTYDQSVALRNAGGVYHDLGLRGRALKCFTDALELSRKCNDVGGEASALNWLGLVYEELGQLSDALAYFERALALRGQAQDTEGTCVTLDNLGLTYSKLGNHSKALKAYRSALRLAQTAGFPGEVATAENNIGYTYWLIGDFTESMKHLRVAFNFQQRVGNLSDEAITLNNIGRDNAELRNFEVALQNYTESITLAREVGLRDQEAMTYSNLCLLFASRHSRALAILCGKLAVNLYQGLRSDASKLAKRSRLSYASTVEFAYRDLAKFLAEAHRVNEAEQVLDLLKDEEFYKQFPVRGKSQRTAVNLTPLEREWASKYEAIFKNYAAASATFEALAAISPAMRTKDEESKMAAITHQFESCNAALNAYLEAARKAFKSASASDDRLNDFEAAGIVAGTLKRLPGRPVTVYTLVTEDGVRMLVNLPSGPRLRLPPHNVPSRDLLNKIVLFRAALRDPRIDPLPLASELYDLLIRPIEPDLRGYKAGTILWSLDWSLRYVPMWALYDSRTKQYLIQKYPSSLFTPRTFGRLSDQGHPKKWRAVEFGVSKGRTVGGIRFPRLSNVPAELRLVARAVGGRPKMDAAFTVRAFMTALGTAPSVVHIATHFDLVPGSETDSFLLFGDGPYSMDRFRNEPNGFLDGVELLVLSACDTADGDIHGDGREFENFASLAQLKGADAVIASLWDVNDKSTAILMGEFYRIRKAHPEWTKLKALQAAQLEMLNGTGAAAGSGSTAVIPIPTDLSQGEKPFKFDPRKPYAHPYYWAPFVLYGNYK
ncbi:MAG: CHAT domain-containing protein [Fimbriimonadaceae bacterium]